MPNAMQTADAPPLPNAMQEINVLPLINYQYQSAANVQSCGKDAEMSMKNYLNIGNTDNLKNQQATQKVTILYERLSVEDDRDTESQSIENQRAILQEHELRT